MTGDDVRHFVELHVRVEIHTQRPSRRVGAMCAARVHQVNYRVSDAPYLSWYIDTGRSGCRCACRMSVCFRWGTGCRSDRMPDAIGRTPPFWMTSMRFRWSVWRWSGGRRWLMEFGVVRLRNFGLEEGVLFEQIFRNTPMKMIPPMQMSITAHQNCCNGRGSVKGVEELCGAMSWPGQ